MFKIVSLVGARPNFMKIAPFIRALNKFNQENGNYFLHTLVHTGQHYDIRMSKVFFNDLNIPEPDINLEVGSGTHAEQVGKTMIEFEKVIQSINPNLVIVVGDVNATLAGSVTAKKELKHLAHIEAGLRSFDMTMPEEINRIVTDRLSDFLFTPDKIANKNLINEGASQEKIHFVGNIMIDTLLNEKEKAQQLDIINIIKNNIINPNSNYNLQSIFHRNYLLMTLHRPSNVDKKEILEQIIHFIVMTICRINPVLFPIHPRTYHNLKNYDLLSKIINEPNFILLHPLRYHEMLRLNMSARAVITDSGGLQEECTVLGTPCYTIRANTERPITLREYGGLSVLIGTQFESIIDDYKNINETSFKPVYPELWDGKTAERIVNTFVKTYL